MRACDTYDTLAGVGTAIDVIRRLGLREGAAVRLDSGDLSDLARGTRRLLDDAGLPWVKIFMSTNLVTLPADADLAEAVAVFDRYPFRRLPLVKDGRIVGMVTVDDLVIDSIADFTRLLRPILGQVLFGRPEPKTPVPSI